jgi:hypothetical protein
VIVYVESNFILEIALGQEHSGAAEQILAAATTGDIKLVLPQFCLSEPFSTLTERGRGRLRLSRMLTEQLRQLDRSSPHKPLLQPLQVAPATLVSFEKAEFDLLESTVGRLLTVGSTIALDGTMFQKAISYRQTYALSAQDATIYSCIVAHMSSQDPGEPKCFVSRNFKDFDDPDIRQELKTYGCEYADSFENAVRFVQGDQPPFTRT